MTNYHVIKVKYLGPTNSRGSRVRLTSERFAESVTIPYNYALNNIESMAKEYLTDKGHYVLGCGEGKECIYLICNSINGEFKRLK